MNNQQELIMLGLMTKYDFKNNINTLDISDIADVVLGSERGQYNCAHFYRKERSEVFTHVLLCLSKINAGRFRIYTGKCDKSYVTEFATDVLKQLPDSLDMLECLGDTFASSSAASGPIYHIPKVNPGERIAKNLHGVILNFMSIVTR